jgi:hypothetical protein
MTCRDAIILPQKHAHRCITFLRCKHWTLEYVAQGQKPVWNVEVAPRARGACQRAAKKAFVASSAKPASQKTEN